jgi:hypothetical protein
MKPTRAGRSAEAAAAGRSLRAPAFAPTRHPRWDVWFTTPSAHRNRDMQSLLAREKAIAAVRLSADPRAVLQQ